MTITLHTLKVFVGESGAGEPVGGNPLGVFLDGGGVPAAERQRTALFLGFPETVFVDDRDSGALRIFTPETELPFAGHPLVGAVWLLSGGRASSFVLRPPAGEVPARRRGEMAYITGRPEWSPPLEHVRYASPEEVDALDGPPHGLCHVGAWAWEDEAAGRVRVRVFAPEIGVAEDEATGSHAIRLCSRLGRTLTIRQGAGSLIEARPLGDGSVEVGGRVGEVEAREFELPG